VTTASQPIPAVNFRDLPRDSRGFAVPAEAPWIDGVPYQSKVEPLLKLVMAAYRACPVCGFALPLDEPVWRIHDEYSRKVTHEEIGSKQLISELDVPGHLVCMLYSALVCPFWRSPGGRLGKDNAYKADGKRGAEPSIMGFGDYAVLVDPMRPIGGDVSQQFTLVYRDYDSEIVFRDPLADLSARYDEERKRCGGRYVTRKRRHYAPVFGGARRLEKEVGQIVDRMSARGPDSVVDLQQAPVGLFGSGFM
jgi:hypothetical protein